MGAGRSAPTPFADQWGRIPIIGMRNPDIESESNKRLNGLKAETNGIHELIPNGSADSGNCRLFPRRSSANPSLRERELVHRFGTVGELPWRKSGAMIITLMKMLMKKLVFIAAVVVLAGADWLRWSKSRTWTTVAAHESVAGLNRPGAVQPGPTGKPGIVTQREDLVPMQVTAHPSPSSSISSPSFAAFSRWVEQYAGTPKDQQPELEARGIEFARTRAAAMATLLKSDPAAAIESALTYEQRQLLPASVAAWVEQPLNASANFEVVAGTPIESGDGNTPPIRRAIRLQGELYEVFTYGAALEWPSANGQPVNGFVLPSSATPTITAAPYPTGKPVGLAVVTPDPTRILDTSESSDYLKTLQSEPICGVSGLPVSSLGTEVVSQTGGTYTSFCRRAHLASVEPADILEGPSGQIVPPSTSLPTTATGGSIANTTWTKGKGKRYIFCRPTFSDYSGYTSDAAVFAAYNGYSNYVVHSSYGQLVPAAIGTDKTQGSYVTPPLRLPGSVADYESGLRDITDDIITAAHAIGINFRGYQFFAIVNADKPGFNAAGLGTIGPSMGTDGGSQSWCRLMGSQTALDSSLLGHELGHNLYLLHSHGWNTDGRSVIGTGSNDEYGDPDSLMGATWGRDSYVANLRYYLGWLSGSSVRTLAGGGNVFQTSLSVLDDNTNGVRAIRIKHPRYSQYYWLEYRSGRSWIDASESANSIGLRWGSPNGSEAWWLNVTPDRLGANRLAVGHTFSDPWGDLHITATGASLTTSNALDVTVAIGPFPDNRPPTVELAADKLTIAAKGSVKFTANATDPDSDTLAYGWDFGGSGADGPGRENTNVVSHTYAAAGVYQVRCVVSDMKGGETTRAISVRVGIPTGFTISGSVVTDAGVPVAGIQVKTDDGHFGYTDNDGNYSINGLAAGSYSLSVLDPIVDGSVFEPWISNPISITKDRAGVGFTSLSPSTASSIRAEYFSDGAWSQTQFVTRSTRIQFPSPSAPDASSARWSGVFQAPLSGPYVLHALGDGFARITVNGQSFAGTMSLQPTNRNHRLCRSFDWPTVCRSSGVQFHSSLPPH